MNSQKNLFQFRDGDKHSNSDSKILPYESPSIIRAAAAYQLIPKRADFPRKYRNITLLIGD